MYAGQKASYNGYQYCLFPLDYLNCTQLSGPDSYSHCCGHPCDWAGPSNDYPYYAPCDCTRTDILASNGQTIYTSDAPVWTPQGLTYVSFLFAHDENIPAATHYSQGDLIGHTGQKSGGTIGAIGDHVHIDQSRIRNDVITSYGVYCAYGNLCYALGSSAYAYNVFYLGGTERIINTRGMSFQTIPSSPEPPDPPEPPGPEPPGPVDPVGNLSAATLLLLLRKRRKLHGKRVTSFI